MERECWFCGSGGDWDVGWGRSAAFDCDYHHKCLTEAASNPNDREAAIMENERRQWCLEGRTAGGDFGPCEACEHSHLCHPR